MTPKDLAELKRRLNPEKRLPSMVYGFYVNEDGEITLGDIAAVLDIILDQ